MRDKGHTHDMYILYFIVNQLCFGTHAIFCNLFNKS